MTCNAMTESHSIEIDGVVLCTVVPHLLGVSLNAIDRHVADLDRSIWPTLEYARDAAEQAFRAAGRNNTMKSGTSLPGRLSDKATSRRLLSLATKGADLPRGSPA